MRGGEKATIAAGLGGADGMKIRATVGDGRESNHGSEIQVFTEEVV